MTQTIVIYYDEQAGVDAGWAYRIDGGASGAIDGRAARAVDSIVGGDEGPDCSREDVADLRDQIGHEPGDLVFIVGPGLPGFLGDLLDR